MKPEQENKTGEVNDRRPPAPPRDRMIHKPASTREVLGRDFHALADTEGKPKHDHD